MLLLCTIVLIGDGKKVLWQSINECYLSLRCMNICIFFSRTSSLGDNVKLYQSRECSKKNFMSAAGSMPGLWLFSFPVTMSVTKLAREEQFGMLLSSGYTNYEWDSLCAPLPPRREIPGCKRTPPSQSVVSIIPVFRKKKVWVIVT